MCEAKNAINHDPEEMNFYCGLQIEKNTIVFCTSLTSLCFKEATIVK